MSEKTGINWTDHTFNPWWGCEKISAACKECYAADWAARWGWGWGKLAPWRFFGVKHWNEPLAWNRRAEERGVPAFVFCASMADLWEERERAGLVIPGDTWDEMQSARLRLYDMIEATPWLVWLLLSKRPGLAPDLVPHAWMHGHWPANAWAGATMENQREADMRAPDLLRLPAPRHFVSYEPAQEAVDFSCVLTVEPPDEDPREVGYSYGPPRRASWIIYGGESGENARPSDVAWGRRMLAQARAAGVSGWFKQTGVRAYDSDAPGAAVEGDARHLAAEVWVGRNAILATPGLVRTLSTAHGSALVDLPDGCRVRERPAPLAVPGFQGVML
jgi:protein gp37